MSPVEVSQDLFHVHAEIEVAADPQLVHRTVSDLPASGRWSPECRGGEWIHGNPGRVGAVFRGDNVRAEQVVAWAPIARGAWQTTAEVVRAEPGRAFSWAMRDSAGRVQDSVWSYEMTPVPGGTHLVHAFRMGAATEGIRGITAGMTAAEKQRFFDEWAQKLRGDLAATLAQIKTVIETSTEGR